MSVWIRGSNALVCYGHIFWLDFESNIVHSEFYGCYGSCSCSDEGIKNHCLPPPLGAELPTMLRIISNGLTVGWPNLSLSALL